MSELIGRILITGLSIGTGIFLGTVLSEKYREWKGLSPAYDSIIVTGPIRRAIRREIKERIEKRSLFG